VQLEAEKPAHGGLAALGLAPEHAVAGDALVVADGNRSGVGDGDALALALEALERGLKSSGTETYAKEKCLKY